MTTNVLMHSKLFQGIKEEEIESMLTCLSARTVDYRKNDFMIHHGETIQNLGVVVSGSVLVIKEDYWGNRTILSELAAGDIFAEAYACLSFVPAEIGVVASKDTTVMFFDIQKILTVCSSACVFHTRLVENLLRVLAGKNLELTKKMECLSKRTIRDRLLSYLSTERLKADSSTFEIPFDRQQLADYLSVDRSALSREIGKLSAEGVISCWKNQFTLTES